MIFFWNFEFWFLPVPLLWSAPRLVVVAGWSCSPYSLTFLHRRVQGSRQHQVSWWSRPRRRCLRFRSHLTALASADRRQLPLVSRRRVRPAKQGRLSVSRPRGLDNAVRWGRVGWGGLGSVLQRRQYTDFTNKAAQPPKNCIRSLPPAVRNNTFEAWASVGPLRPPYNFQNAEPASCHRCWTLELTTDQGA